MKDTAYVEGENVAIVYRFAKGDVERLPAPALRSVLLNQPLLPAAVATNQ